MNVFRPPRQVRMKNNHRDIGCVRTATFLFSHLIAFIFLSQALCTAHSFTQLCVVFDTRALISTQP